MIEKDRIIKGLNAQLKELQDKLDRYSRIKTPPAAMMQLCADIAAYKRVLKGVESLDESNS